MIVNPDSFQAIMLKSESKTKVNLGICDKTFNITDLIKLLKSKLVKM